MPKMFVFSFVTLSFLLSSFTFALELIHVGVQQVGDIAPAAHMAARRADVLFVPTDNLLAAAVSVVAKVAVSHKKPLLVSDVLLLKQGAFAGQGIDYFKSGGKAAQIASQVLFRGAQPSTIALSSPIPTEVMINEKTRSLLGLGEMP